MQPTASIQDSKNNRIRNFSKVIKLNRLIHCWRSKFEEPPTAPLAFSLNEQNQLLLNDIPICDIADVKEDECQCGLETFFIGSNSCSGYYRIRILWDCKDRLFVNEVSLVLYRATGTTM